MDQDIAVYGVIAGDRGGNTEHIVGEGSVKVPNAVVFISQGRRIEIHGKAFPDSFFRINRHHPVPVHYPDFGL